MPLQAKGTAEKKVTRFASVDRILNVTATPGHVARRRRSLL